MTTTQHTNHTVWDRRLAALDSFYKREGHALVPAKHVENVEGEDFGLGAWVSYVRTRYRNQALRSDRIATLESYNGWQWGPLRPGPKPDNTRDNKIRDMRNNGKSLQEIGDAFGLSRQRIHQIVAT